MGDNMKKYFGYLIMIGIFLFCIIYASIPKSKEYHKNLFYMDTYITITFLESEPKKASRIMEEIENIYQEYHQLTDRYHPYEGIINLYTIYHNVDASETLTLSPKLYTLLKYGEAWYEKSNHLLDITMGNVIDIWKNYRERKNGVPTIEELQKALESKTELVLLPDYKIKNNHPNLDLGALAKGYVTNIVSDYLKENHVTSFIINAGGNVFVGEKKRGTYKIGIENPDQSGSIFKTVLGNNISVVTSGGYERNYEYNGKQYHHIIHPVTLFPTDYMKSVTVITKDSALGDALSTILFLMDVEEGMEYIKTYKEVEAIWYLNDGTIKKTEGVTQYE